MQHRKFHIDEIPDFPRIEANDGPEPFHEVIAYWLATLCELSYCTSSEIARALSQLGFKEVTFFGFRGTSGFLTSHRQRFSVLVFRGTMKDYKNIITDISFLTRPVPDMDIRAHGGVVTALSDVWGTCFPSQSNMPEGISVNLVGAAGITNVLTRICCASRCYFTGHSLGGALATLAAMRLVQAKEYEEGSQFDNSSSGRNHDRSKSDIGMPRAIYTFGSPRVGCKDFVAKMKASGIASYRVVNSTDIIAELPLPFGFRHINEVVYLTEEGNIRRATTGCRRYRLWEFLKACPALLSLFMPHRLVRALKSMVFTNHRIGNYRYKLAALAMNKVNLSLDSQHRAAA